MSKKIIKAATAPKLVIKAVVEKAPKVKTVKVKAKGKKAAAPKVVKEKATRVIGQYVGKTLVAGVKSLDDTRLRADSTRGKAVLALIKAGKKGMKFEDYKVNFPVGNLRWLTAKKEVIVRA